ncbi:MAG TPA: phosphomevalonate kinase [Pantanalinema sp.]
MTIRTIVASAPGKLVLAGEYAVLSPGEPAVVVAVDARITVRVRPAGAYSFSSESLGLTDLPVRYEDERWVPETGPAPRVAFAATAVNVVLGYLRDRGLDVSPFSLEIEGALESTGGAKYGFGSSAAVSVALVGGLLAAFGLEPDAAQVFKLAALAHHEAQGSGSGLDVAAASYGGAIRYVAFDPDWLNERRAAGDTVAQLVDGAWPLLGIEPLGWPDDLALGIGWTGVPASTSALIKEVAGARSGRSPGYARFLIQSRQATNALAAALRDRDAQGAVRALFAAREAIRVLQEASGVSIETPALSAFAEASEAAGGAGKSSGAGGGDCGVALFAGSQGLVRARAAWERSGLEALDVSLSRTGLSLSR